jgi:hypothetical protein
LRGQDTPLKTNSLVVGADNAYNRAENFVGNILGTTGSETQYESTALEPSGYIWDLDSQAEHYDVQNDPVVGESLLRWGNYDTATKEVGWNDSEIPDSSNWANCGPGVYVNCNSVPSSETLPASFYLSSQPTFWQTTWGTPPWPGIGPDVSNAPNAGGSTWDGVSSSATTPYPLDGVSSMSYPLPTQICAANASIDPAYQQTFTITSASWTSGTETITINSGATTNPLETGDTVNVQSNQSGANGIFQAKAVGGSSGAWTFSYALASQPATQPSGGSVTYPNMLLYNGSNCYPQTFAAGAELVTTLNSIAFDSSNDVYVVQVTLTNAGNGPTDGVEITSATLGGAQATTTLPLSVGTILYQAQDTVALEFPASAGSAGQQTTLQLSESCSSGCSLGNLSPSLQVVLP